MSTSLNKDNLVDHANEFDFGKLFAGVYDNKKYILYITSLFVLLALLFAIFATPVYQANALVQVEDKQGNALINSLSQILPGEQPETVPEVVLLKSRMILGKTVDDLNLQAQVSQKYFPFFGRGWARLFGEKPGVVRIGRLYIEEKNNKTPTLLLKNEGGGNYFLSGGGYSLNGHVGQLLEAQGLSLLVSKLDGKKGQEFTVQYVSWLDAISKLSGAFNASDVGKDTGMLVLKLSGSDPEMIQETLNNIADNYLAQNISREAAQDSKSLSFLNQQLPQVRADLDNAEDKLSAYRKRSDSVDLNLQTQSTLNQIVNVDNQLNELTFREAEISQLFTKDHPTYKALLEKRGTLEKEKLRLTKQVSAMPAAQQQVLQLSRNVESGRAVYMQLLNRQQELNIAKNSTIGNVRIVDNAVTEPAPIKPNRILIVIAGLVLGIFVSIGTILVKLFLHRGIDSPEQLENLGVNVYASIPISEWMQKQGANKSRNKSTKLLAEENSADLAIEAIRNLRTSLHFAMMEAKNNILMISGASPNAGKTFIASNLAAVIASSGKKVLLIDADMRKGHIHEILEDGNQCGLSNILSDKKITPEVIVKRVKKGGFDFISRGEVPPNPSELLMMEAMEKLLQWANNNYDLVIVDTPPILAVTDGAIIGRYAGTSFVVARFEKNTPKEIEVSINRFKQNGVEIKGCILNGVVKKAMSYYGYGYSHYGYSYNNK